MLGRADERGVDVRGLIWRSHMEMLNFSAEENRLLGRQLQSRGAEALLDMRVRTGGSHHQKMVVIRYRDRPEDDVAYVGGIDLCHSRRDDAEHLGDPQALEMAPEYGDTPPWHDVMAAISGPAVHDVETVFRERWEDPTRLTRHPLYWTQDKLRRMDMTPDPLPEQAPPPPSPEGATQVVQLLRTYPNLRRGRDYPFARGGERSVARGYTKAVSRARKLIYIEDQYLWGQHVGDVFTEALHRNPDLHVIAVVPLFTDQAGFMARTPQLLGRARAMRQMTERGARPGRDLRHREPPGHAGLRAREGVHDRRHLGHDRVRQLQPPLVDPRLGAVGGGGGPVGGRPQSLRAPAAADPGGRAPRPGGGLTASLLEVMADCVDAAGMFAAYAETARRLDDWHSGGRVGERPPGRLRRLQQPQLSTLTRAAAMVPYLLLHDPDGRPKPLRKKGGF